MKDLIEKALAERIFEAENFNGFKSSKWEGTSNICECTEGGEDGCSE